MLRKNAAARSTTSMYTIYNNMLLEWTVRASKNVMGAPNDAMVERVVAVRGELGTTRQCDRERDGRAGRSHSKIESNCIVQIIIASRAHNRKK